MTTTPPFSPEALLPTLQLPAVTTGYCVALSGGADSVALLVAMAQLRPMLGKPVRAIHIHHGLQADADDWSAFCEALCRRLDTPLRVIGISIERQRRESLEMAARRQRYRVLADALESDEALLTAHHLDDQAETLLLHLFRGAGVDGLSAMPPMRPFARGVLLRPLLPWRREALQAFLERQGVAWVEDPSNSDIGFDRNYLRRVVLPAIEARWPAAPQCIARSARLQADQRDAIDVLVEQDFSGCYRFESGGLSVKTLLALPTQRQDLVLRRWLRTGQPRLTLSAALITQLKTLLHSGGGGELRIGDVVLRLSHGALFKMFLWSPGTVPSVEWRLERPLHIEEAGVYLEASQMLRTFPCLDSLTSVEVGCRCGGEVIAMATRGRRPLKKMLHEWGVPRWLREHILLIARAGCLLAVVGYWLDEEAC